MTTLLNQMRDISTCVACLDENKVGLEVKDLDISELRRVPVPCGLVLDMEYLTGRFQIGSSHASLSHAAHAGLPDAARGGKSCATDEKRRNGACGTRAGQHAGRENVCGVSRGIARGAGSVAEDGRDAF